ncbi:MAG TPA: triose-phosphate isomerase [Lutibacter sp.]|nr:triose-phosphate isomerase [Lutibacter sp.]
MRTKIVAGNWKMNLDVTASIELAESISKEITSLKTENTRIVVAPTAINLYPVTTHADLDNRVEIAAQNMHQATNGAFTGEISAEMIKNVGVQTVILGHSERRTYFNETDKALAEKVTTALKNELDVIFCFGEVLEERQSNNHFKVVESQLQNALFHLEEKDWKTIVLAYEPVWAIGTGETASPEQAQEMHAFIRTVIEKKFGKTTAQQISILYGGSVKPSNAKEIFSQPDVDGGLIGGAALNAVDFVALIKAIQ